MAYCTPVSIRSRRAARFRHQPLWYWPITHLLPPTRAPANLKSFGPL